MREQLENKDETIVDLHIQVLIKDRPTFTLYM